MQLIQKIIYALPAIPLAALTLPIMIYLPTFYAQDMGMGLAMVGICLLIARMIDVISDPLIGIASDKIGTRKIWIIGGLLPTLIGTWFLLNPPLDQANAFYFIGFSCLLYIGWTCMLLPLNALGAELSDDYNERTSITSWREGFTTLGLLIPLSIVAAMGYAGEDSADKALNIIALLTVILLPICTLIFGLFLNENFPAKAGIQNSNKKDWIPDQVGDVRSILKPLNDNTPFKRLIFSFLINSMANALPATLFLLFVEHIIGAKDMAGQLLFIYFFSGILGIPFWYWLSKKTSKHRAWSYAMVFSCCVFLTVPFVIGAGDTTIFLIICVLTGLTLGADLALPASIQADVVDVDRDMTGENRTGLFFAMWSMVTKLSLALSAGIFLPLLALTGFNEVSGDNAYALPYFYAFVPVILKIIAIIPMWNFPLTKK